MSARFSIYFSARYNSSPLVEKSLAVVKKGMSDGKLSLSHPAIIRLKWREVFDKTLLTFPSVTPAQSEPLDSWNRNWPILLGAILALLFILLALLWRRKKKMKENFQKMEDDIFILRANLSDIESIVSQRDDDSTMNKLFCESILTLNDVRILSTTQTPSNALTDENRTMTWELKNVNDKSFQDADFLGFIEERKIHNDDWNPRDDASYKNDEDDVNYLSTSHSFSILGSEMLHLRHIHPILKARPSDSITGSSALFSMDDSGRIFDPSLICSICNKSMEGMARKFCACGNEDCSISAHMLCVLEKYPLIPSVSHPGTPPTMLPIRLCRYRPKT